MSQWISVKDSLPDKCGQYLGVTENRKICIVTYCIRGKISDEGELIYGKNPEFTISITHYAKLPELPKGV